MTSIIVKPTEKYIESYKKASKAYYNRSKDTILAKASIYYEKNRESILEKKKLQYALKRQANASEDERSESLEGVINSSKKNYYQEVYKVKKQKEKEEQVKIKLIELGINQTEIILDKFSISIK